MSSPSTYLYSAKHIRDREGLLATIGAIEASGRPISSHERRFLSGLRAETSRAPAVILSGDRIEWLRSLARRHRAGWEEGDRLAAPKAAKRSGRAGR